VRNAALLAAAVLGCGTAVAQTYPSKPIRVVIGAGAGGGTDILGRTLGPKVTELLGQQIIIDNRPGAATNIGAELVARAAPDGYTLLMASSPHVINPSLFAKLPFDPVTDFAPVCRLAVVQNGLVVHPSLPVKSVKELIALAKSRPGKLNFGSSAGTSQFLAVELFKTMAGIDVANIPYRGGGPALTDLLAGQVEMQFNTLLALLPFIKAGKVRALAVAGAQRSAVMPEMPTVSEAGLRGFEASGFYGLFAPANTPRDIVTRLNTAYVAVLTTPEMKKRLNDQGVDVIAGTPDELAEYVREQMPKWAKVVKASGAKIE